MEPASHHSTTVLNAQGGFRKGPNTPPEDEITSSLDTAVERAMYIDTLSNTQAIVVDTYSQVQKDIYINGARDTHISLSIANQQ